MGRVVRPFASFKKSYVALQQYRGGERSGRSQPRYGDLVMAIAASFADSPREPPASRQPGFLKRLVDALAASHARMYLAAITDPATGCIDPVRERAVLRAMVL